MNSRLARFRHLDRTRKVDLGLSALTVLQIVTLFVVLPLSDGDGVGETMLDVSHGAFAAICIGLLARRRSTRVALMGTLVLLLAWPALRAGYHVDRDLQHAMISAVAFAFNAGVTALIARHVFGRGEITVHRVRGAVLLYLNVAALFSIADAAVAMHIPGAYAGSTGLRLTELGARSTATFSYFSLATITTLGYGDIVPVAPIARTLANMEAVFGQLFPATLLSRLVMLQLEADHRRRSEGRPEAEASRDDTSGAIPRDTRRQPPA